MDDLSDSIRYNSDNVEVFDNFDDNATGSCPRNILRENCPSRVMVISEDEMEAALRQMMDSNNPDSNNGLITKIWGSHAWDFGMSVCFGYPINPTEEQKETYLQFFKSLANVLPCGACRDSTNEFYLEENTKLDMSVMESRETLARWFYRLRNRVNKKLGVDYGVDFKEVCYKFESYRARCSKNEKGCIMPVNMKAMSYQKSEIKRAPIIDEKYSKAFISYANSLGLNGYQKILEETILLKTKRNSKKWMIRDLECVKTIKYMRKNGKLSLNNEGLPTEDELMLLAMLSSNLGSCELDEVLITLGNYNKS